MKTENDQTKLLWKELKSENPSEAKIRELVSQGADISGDFLKEAIARLTPYRDDFGKACGTWPDNKLWQLLIDLGAEVNFEDFGFNCLFDAVLGWNPELFELLVKAGANVNCFSDEEYTSLLSWVEFDQWYEECEGSGGGEPLAKIVEIMKQYGAKPTDDCIAEKPERYISINQFREHGMVTMGGLLAIEKIPGVSQELINEFNEWLKSSHQEWMKEKIDPAKDEWTWKSPPDLAQLIQHKEKGLVLAKQIKSLVGECISVDYYFVEPDSVECFRKIMGHLKITM
jgi:hypothetical protein